MDAPPEATEVPAEKPAKPKKKRKPPVPPKFEVGDFVLTKHAVKVRRDMGRSMSGYKRNFLHVVPGAEWVVKEVVPGEGRKRPEFVIVCQGVTVTRRENQLRLVRKKPEATA